MSPYILENCVNFSPVLFSEKWALTKFEGIFERVRTIFLKKPRKSGQKPGFENQKWAEKFGGIF